MSINAVLRIFFLRLPMASIISLLLWFNPEYLNITVYRAQEQPEKPDWGYHTPCSILQKRFSFSSAALRHAFAGDCRTNGATNLCLCHTEVHEILQCLTTNSHITEERHIFGLDFRLRKNRVYIKFNIFNFSARYIIFTRRVKTH